MENSRVEYTERREQEVRLWLRIRGFLYERYLKLSTHLKSVLRNLICTPTKTTTYEQRKDLYIELCLPDSIVAGKKAIDPLDSMTDEQRKKVFSPLTPSEKRSYFDKF